MAHRVDRDDLQLVERRVDLRKDGELVHAPAPVAAASRAAAMAAAARGASRHRAAGGGAPRVACSRGVRPLDVRAELRDRRLLQRRVGLRDRALLEEAVHVRPPAHDPLAALATASDRRLSGRAAAPRAPNVPRARPRCSRDLVPRPQLPHCEDFAHEQEQHAAAQPRGGVEVVKTNALYFRVASQFQLWLTNVPMVSTSSERA